MSSKIKQCFIDKDLCTEEICMAWDLDKKKCVFVEASIKLFDKPKTLNEMVEGIIKKT